MEIKSLNKLWTKTKIFNMEAYYIGNKCIKHEFTLGDLDKVNNDPDRYSIDHYFMQPQLIREYIAADHEVLPSDVYKVVETPSTWYAVKDTPENKNLILDLDIGKEITGDFKTFQDSENIYRELNILYKRGVLLFGPPGTGKTTALHRIITDLRPKESIVMFVKTIMPLEFVQAFQQDKRLKIIVFEEITENLHNNSDIQEFLDFLDGEHSLDNCFIVGTTNYPEKLPSNIVNRPGRFDKFYKVDYLQRKDIYTYTEYMLKRELSPEEKTCLDCMEEVTIATLKEILLIVLRDKASLADAIKLLLEQKQLVKNDFVNRKGIGFTD